MQSATHRLAQRTLQMVQLLTKETDTRLASDPRTGPGISAHVGALPTPRVLVLEPRSESFGRVLRSEGFSGELQALVRPSLTLSPLFSRLRSAYDEIAVWNWSEVVDDLQGNFTPGTHNEPPHWLGAFSAIVVHDVSRLVPLAQIGALLSFLSRFVRQRGYILMSELSPAVDIVSLERRLSRDGLLLAADVEVIEDDWPRLLATFQNRGTEEAHLIGQLSRLTWPVIESDPALQDSLVKTYQVVFGGDEWREWMRCTRPGADHRYSRSEVELLPPPVRCACGWPRPLQLFHPHDAIISKLYHDVAQQQPSCCYVRINHQQEVEGFTWGYVASVADVAHILAESEQGAVCSDLRECLASFVREHAGVSTSSEPADVVDQKVFYHSELGVQETVRSLSLARGLFHRAFQFAYDHGASVVVLRTALTSPAFDICMGLGMRLLYRYQGRAEYNEANRRWEETTAGAVSRSTRHKHSGARDHGTHIPDRENHPLTDRVVVGGSLLEMLGFLGSQSDRRLVMRMLRVKRKERSL